VAWYRLVVQDPQRVEAPEPVVLRDGRSLLIPFGSRLEYYVQLPPEGAFTAEGVEWLGEGGGRLELVLEEDGKSPTHLVTLEEPTQGLEVSIRGAAPRIARLSLRAERPFVRSDARSGVILVQPALRVPPGRPEPSDRRSEAETSGAPVEQRPNILLYVVDTLRADHLGVYGYSKPVSPHIDRFAADATVFDNALAQSSWTRASMASIFTGLWPVKHAANGRKDILDPAAETLAEILHAAGYVTVARVRNWNVFPVFGFRQGFEDFVAVDRGKADRMNALVRQWLDRRPRERPFFLYVHTVDPHGPYRPPGEFRTRFFEPDQEPLELDRHPGFRVTEAMTEEERLAVARHLLALYDGEIAFNDREFGRLLSMLEDEQLLDHTMIVFVSDHGEEFLEHGTWEHGRNLFAENLNVPLIIRIADRGRGRHIGEVVQHIDLMATILDHAGLPIPEQVEGRSLLALLDQADEEAAGQARPAFSFLHLDGLPHRSLVAGDWKLIERLSPEGTVLWEGLFHRGEDPLEARNRARDYPILTRYMGLLLEAKVAEGSLLTTEEAVLDARTERALRALGYLQ
jgi:arylsulfatase A-like enzyme